MTTNRSRQNLRKFKFPLLAVLLFPAVSYTQPTSVTGANRAYTIETCISAFDGSRVESTKVGYQYWFADRRFADGKTVKLSVVGPHKATHAPHRHPEDEFFFVLEGSAEVYLDGDTRIIGPMTSFYAPSNAKHGIRNAGDVDLRYLVLKRYENVVDVSPFWDSAHHWYDINDEDRTIEPRKDQKRYDETDVGKIADNILLYQRSNGGWPKNYDMLAVLTDGQRTAVAGARKELNTCFDNGATYTQVEYLARAFAVTDDARHRAGALSGLRFMLQAQYPNGGWPQFFPDTSGYRRHITFNDGAMMGVMKVLKAIVEGGGEYAFVPDDLRRNVEVAYGRGLSAILRAQVMDGAERTVWCQQHDNSTLLPAAARTFELASLCSMESAEIVLFLMSIRRPTPEVVEAVNSAVRWFEHARIDGIRVKTVAARRADYQFHSTDKDKEVVQDASAPPIWPRFVELGTGRPLFANRDGQAVYSLAEVERERRTGYAWYTYDPQEVLRAYPRWRVATAGTSTRPDDDPR